jgi:GTP-binding protein HflX
METGLAQERILAERTILVQVRLPSSDVDERDPMGELRALAETAGVTVVGEMEQNLKVPRGATYLGKGKVEELAAMVQALDAKAVVFDNDLSPSQVQGLEEGIRCKVLDRSELILDIFANRATTRQAQLQVEIAQLQYTAPRLRAMWSHLGQVTGGAPVGVGTRGPGEQQLEIDRRLVKSRVDRLKGELDEIAGRKQREVQARRTEHFTAGLVGYTNAGKSSLFNALTRGGAFANDQLFATLGTRVEQWNLGGGNACMLSDTVGFIRDLPHHLVASFRSTLEDAVHAHVLLLVVDVSDPRAEVHLDVVQRTLDEIGATEPARLLVLNKSDRLDAMGPREAERVHPLSWWMERHPEALSVSARTGAGLDALATNVLERMKGAVRTLRLTVPLRDARTVDFLEKRCPVHARDYVDASVTLTVDIGRRQVEQLLSRGARFEIEGVSANDFVRKSWDPPPTRADRGTPPHERVVGEW